jgi:hypothetical protein
MLHLLAVGRNVAFPNAIEFHTMIWLGSRLEFNVKLAFGLAANMTCKEILS